MPIPRSLRRWLSLPSRMALLLGLGALSAAGAGADAAPAHPDAGIGLPGPGDLLVRSDAGRIYLAEHGGEFRELTFRDVAQARLLTRLLEQNGGATDPSGIRLSPIILAGSGGQSIHWGAARNPGSRGPAASGRSEKAGNPANPAPSERTGKTTNPAAADKG